MTSPNDRFSQPAPKYITPTQDNYGVLIPPKKDHTPGVALEQQIINRKVSELLEQAKALSNQCLQGAQEMKRSNTSRKIRYSEAHVMSDIDFIRVTRSMSIHDKGAMSLLLANGGSELLERGLLPAQAFDQLRKEKINKMRPVPNATFDKRPTTICGKVWIKGLPTTSEKAAKNGMYLVKSKTDK